ncbi:MAG: hypothetical protein Q9213_008053 [Squamulea squamosa]
MARRKRGRARTSGSETLVDRSIDGTKNGIIQPTMLVAVASHQVPTNIADRQSSFPFMRLPTELRLMVYNYYFFQEVKHHHPHGHCWAGMPGGGARCEPGRPVWSSGTINKGMHFGNLWAAGKAVYHEAMPIYFKKHHFRFSCIEQLGKFFTAIPYYPRQYITKLSFCYKKHPKTQSFHAQEPFNFLLECPNLVELSITVRDSEMYYLIDTKQLFGFKTLLQLRGIKKLEVKFPGSLRIFGLPSQTGYNTLANSFVDQLSVLKEPYTAAETRRREAKGISKDTVLRTCFDGSEKQTRTQRYEKRKRLKEIM